MLGKSGQAGAEVEFNELKRRMLDIIEREYALFAGGDECAELRSRASSLASELSRLVLL